MIARRLCGSVRAAIRGAARAGEAPLSSTALLRASADWGDDDGGDEGSAPVEIGIAFGQDMDRGEFILPEQISQPTETPAQDHHIGGGEGEREFLRRCALVIAPDWIWFQGVINQLAGVKAVAMLLVEKELDAGAILTGCGMAVVFGEVHGVIGG